MSRTFGIEEEFFLADSQTAQLSDVPQEAIDRLAAEDLAGSEVMPELLASQLELVSGICESGEEALATLRSRRQKMDSVCSEYGLLPLAVGTPPHLPQRRTLTQNRRYEQIQEFVPGIVREHYINGLHIHVHIPDAETGIKAMNLMRRRLPAIAAIGANSPLWDGELTGFESWRMVHYRRWSVVGIPPAFTSADDYLKYREALLATGALLDAGHIGWAVRLSERNPTLEIRAADTQLTAADSVAIALLIRAIVDTGLDGGIEPAGTDDGLLDLGLWQASKMGLRGPHYDPLTGQTLAPSEMLDRVLEFSAEQLAHNGDLEYVQEHFEGLKNRGNGAQLQRASWERGQGPQVVHDAHKLFGQ